VVSFDDTSLPEVIGDAGLLVADGEVLAMSMAVRNVLDSPGLYEELCGRGPLRAASFSWERTAEATLSAYADVAG
jgi:glycosyltransferase involved in cell wall biosynthesis